MLSTGMYFKEGLAPPRQLELNSSLALFPLKPPDAVGSHCSLVTYNLALNG